MGAKRVSKQGVTVSAGNAIEVTNTAGTVLFSVDNTGNIGALPNLTAKGSILTASATSTPTTLAVGTNEHRLVADSATTSGLKYVADTTNYAIAAKGDLLVGTAADTVAALTVGSNGDTLVADSAQSTGLRYNPPVGSLANPVINGGFDIWQRGTSSTTTGAYLADRWWNGNLTGATYSRQTTSDTTNLPNIQYCLRMQRNSGVTSTDGCNAVQSFETVNSIPFAGKTVTLSFYARKGADLSSNLKVYLHSGTGTDQFYWTGYTGGASPITATLSTSNLTTTWQRFAYSGTISASATELSLQFLKESSGTAGAADYVEFTGVQLDVGTWTASTAPTFRRSGGTIQGELSACQRYYYRANADSVYTAYGNGLGESTTTVAIVFQMPVPMRVTPTSIDYSNVAVYDGDGLITTPTSFSLTAANSSKDRAWINWGKSGGGIVDKAPYIMLANNTTSSYIGVSAEL